MYVTKESILTLKFKKNICARPTFQFMVNFLLVSNM